jgi:hypothetical protein
MVNEKSGAPDLQGLFREAEMHDAVLFFDEYANFCFSFFSPLFYYAYNYYCILFFFFNYYCYSSCYFL